MCEGPRGDPARQLAAEAPDSLLEPVGLSVAAIREVAAQVGATLLTLRPTAWGTCIIAALPDGRIAGRLLEGLTTDAVFKLLVSKEDRAGSGGWMVDYERYRSAPPETEEETARRWFETLDGTLGSLGEQLWRPLRVWLGEIDPPGDPDEDLRPLIILPGQGLNALPLHACWWSCRGEHRWSSDEYAISYAPSIQVLNRRLRHEENLGYRPDRLLAVRHPTGSDPRFDNLRGGRRKINDVRALFASCLLLGQALDPEPATRERLLRELPRFPVALFATHGTYDAADPWSRSGLCTADAEIPAGTSRTSHWPISWDSTCRRPGWWCSRRASRRCRITATRRGSSSGSPRPCSPRAPRPSSAATGSWTTRLPRL